MPNRSKQKGARFELEVVELLQAGGLDAEKVPLSGAIKGGSFEGDINCRVRGEIRKLECKRRKNGCTTYYGYMENNYAVVMRDDRTPALIMLRLDDFIKLVST